MASSVTVELGDVVAEIVDRLAAQNVHIPPYVIRDALLDSCHRNAPELPIDQISLDEHTEFPPLQRSFSNMID